jgi:hypothetical protein
MEIRSVESFLDYFESARGRTLRVRGRDCRGTRVTQGAEKVENCPVIKWRCR